MYFLTEEKKMEKEREENIRRKKIFCLAEEKNNGEGKGGKHLEKEKKLWRR